MWSRFEKAAIRDGFLVEWPVTSITDDGPSGCHRPQRPILLSVACSPLCEVSHKADDLTLSMLCKL